MRFFFYVRIRTECSEDVNSFVDAYSEITLKKCVNGKQPLFKKYVDVQRCLNLIQLLREIEHASKSGRFPNIFLYELLTCF